MKTNMIMLFYEDLKVGGGIFVGKRISAESFSYCVKNEVLFAKIIENINSEEVVLIPGGKYVIESDIPSELIKDLHEGKDYIFLKDLAQILDLTASRFTEELFKGDRELAFWGCGKTLELEWDILSKRMEPAVIFDREKTGRYKGVRIERFDKNKHKSEKYVIVITNQKYKDEISGILKESGFEYGKDFLFDTQYLNSTLSAMFMKAIQADRMLPVKCSRPFEYVNVGEQGEITHCCYTWLPYFVGNVKDIEEGMLDSAISRIIRLSFLNRSYCFCNKELCYVLQNVRKDPVQNMEHLDKEPFQHIVSADMAFDRSCNLYCSSCRNSIEVCRPEENMQISNAVREKLMPYLFRMTVAGNGEVFLSKPYQAILQSGIYREMDLFILSNGNLFHEEFINEIAGNFKSISLMFSVDAASKGIYEKVRRGGNWERLLHNLRIASELKQNGQIKNLVLRFVVSMNNVADMPAFVELGKSLKADWVDFSKIENWGTFTEEEFNEICIEKAGKYKKEIEDVMALPIMQDPIVKLQNI